MSVYIATLAEIKADLGITDTTDDAVLTRLIEAVQGRFDTYCRRIFLEVAARQEIHDGGTSRIFVEAWPIESVSEVVIDGDQEWGSAESILASDDYLVDNRRGAILYGRGDVAWPSGKQCVRVTYSGGLVASDGTAANGYVDAGHLQTLKRALMMQVEFEWRNRLTLGQQSASMQGASVSLAPAALLPEVSAALSPLVRWL